jgi:CRISPR-associated protein Cmr6
MAGNRRPQTGGDPKRRNRHQSDRRRLDREPKRIPARPLYSGTERAKLAMTTDRNASLWYDKFCDRWLHYVEKDGERLTENSWKRFAGDSGKRDWIETIANIGTSGSRKTVGDGTLLNEAQVRLKALVDARNGCKFKRATAWRFVTGLGRNHPVENGFAWHHDLGVPYIAGSSLKGLARAYARDWSGLADEDLQRIFGPKPEDGLAIGSVVFLDALPTEPVALDADVMTPHYGPWYQEGKVPGDWHSPTPIPFLTVAPGQMFLFGLLPRNPLNEQDRRDCKKAADLLNQALETLGAGAKTAVGYGQFVDEGSSEPGADTQATTTRAPAPSARGQENWTGREAIVYSEVVQIIDDRGDRLLVRFTDGNEEEVERREARLR